MAERQKKVREPNCECTNCRKPMYLPKCRLTAREQHFCSNSCASSYRMRLKNAKYREDLNAKCTYCGKLFHRKKSHLSKGNNFCCKECQQSFRKQQRVTYTCLVCGKEFTRPKCDTNVKFCSNKCRDEYQRRFREIHKCAYCGKEVSVTQITKKRNKTGLFFCSNKCVGKYFRGERSPSYTGNSDVVKVLRTYYALYQRPQIFERDNKVCQVCGGRAENVHHIYPIYKMIQDFKNKHPDIDMTKDVYLVAKQVMEECPEFLDLNNLMSVCEDCHHKLHTEERKKLWRE